MILAFRTDQPEAQLYLMDNAGSEITAYKWLAGRELSNQLLQEVSNLLKSYKKSVKDISGVIVFEGPGSFTGLRIGIAVANALAYSLQVPVVASGGDNWKSIAFQALQTAEQDSYAAPVYGASANITQPKK